MIDESQQALSSKKEFAGFFDRDVQ